MIPEMIPFCANSIPSNRVETGIKKDVSSPIEEVRVECKIWLRLKLHEIDIFKQLPTTTVMKWKKNTRHG